MIIYTSRLSLLTKKVMIEDTSVETFCLVQSSVYSECNSKQNVIQHQYQGALETNDMCFGILLY